MPVSIFLFMNIIVAVSSFVIAYRLINAQSFTDSLIAWLIFYFTQIIFSELVLGFFGMLFLKNVILLNLIVLLIVWQCGRKHSIAFDLKPLKAAIPGLFNNKVIFLGVCIISCFGLVKVFINLVNPPFGWDSLNYHFTFAVEWLKHGNLVNPITICDDPAPTYYPIGGSLFFLWLIFPFKSVFLADLGQVPFFVLSFLAAYSISRKIGLDRDYSFLAATLFFIIPNFFKQLQIAYVDVILAALFLTCVNYLLLLDREFSFKNVLILSLGVGLLLGTKNIALPYAALLLIPFVYLSAKNMNRVYLFIFSIIIVLSLGAFSYIRNIIETGNPLYPFDFNLFGQPLLKGVIAAADYRSHLNIENYRLSRLLFHEGLGLQALIFILPSIFLALPATLLRRKTVNFVLAYFMILPLLLYLVYRYMIPIANARYLYPLLGLGVILGFYTAMVLNINKHFINIASFACILSSMGQLAKRQELVVSMLLTFSVFVLAVILIKQKAVVLINKTLFIPALSSFLIILLVLLQKDYIKNEYPRYIKMVKYSGFWPDAARAWDWLNNNTLGNNVAYVGRPVPFPLYGTNFKNNVYYVSVNKTEPAKLHYFPHSRYHWGNDFLSLHKNLEENGNYRGGADYSVWLNNLNKRNTDFLFVYSLHQTRDIEFPIEDNWAENNAEKFKPVFINQTIHIYKIIR